MPRCHGGDPGSILGRRMVFKINPACRKSSWHVPILAWLKLKTMLGIYNRLQFSFDGGEIRPELVVAVVPNSLAATVDGTRDP